MAAHEAKLTNARWLMAEQKMRRPTRRSISPAVIVSGTCCGILLKVLSAARHVPCSSCQVTPMKSSSRTGARGSGLSVRPTSRQFCSMRLTAEAAELGRNLDLPERALSVERRAEATLLFSSRLLFSSDPSLRECARRSQRCGRSESRRRSRCR
jgi:hypothetical protein